MRRRILCFLLVLLLGLCPSPLLAAPLGQQPSILVSPDTARPGQTVHVTVSGLTAQANTTSCLGILGPGQNVQLGISPSFRLRLGQIAVGADGTGQTDVQVPTQLVAGVYQVTVGGCPPQPDLPPLAALATTTLTVTVSGLQTTYYFAEGATVPPFDTWLLLFNPNSAPATATVTFLSNGVLGTQAMFVPPNSRASLYVNDVFPNANFGMRVDSNLPIGAERAMYFRDDGTDVPGIVTPSIVWLFGEGSTAFPHQTWFLLMNPNTTATNATLTFFLEGGSSQNLTVSIPPLSRSTIYANLVLPSVAFATRVFSDLPIVAERSMYKADTGSGMAAAGSPNPSSSWFFAEGSTSVPFDTWYLMYNPNPNPVQVQMNLLLDTGGPGPSLSFTLPPTSRQSIYMNQMAPNVNFGATVVSSDGSIVVERSMFFRLGQTGSQGATSLAKTWFFSEGATAPPFDEWILLANPSGQSPANVTLTFFFPDGTTSSQRVVVGGGSRTSLFLNLLLPPTAVSTRVDSDQPIVAERSMYFRQGGTNAVGVPQ